MVILGKVPPVMFICLMIWYGAPAGSQPTSSESSDGSHVMKTDTMGVGTQTWTIQPTSSAKFVDLHTHDTLTLSSGQFMASANTVELNSKTLIFGTSSSELQSSMSAIQDITLAPSSTAPGSVPTILPSPSVTQPLSQATFSVSSDSSMTTGQHPTAPPPPPTATASVADTSSPFTAYNSLTSQSFPLNPSDASSELQSSATSEFGSYSQQTQDIQPTSTEWGTASDTSSLQSAMTQNAILSDSTSLSSLASTQNNHLSSSLTSATQSSFLSASSSSVNIAPTAVHSPATASGYATLTPPSKPTGSGSSAVSEEDQDEQQPSKKETSPTDLSSGAQTAIAVIVTLCVLGVIVAVVVLYRRYNITHRSLKTFLTSGVRYKTYNNATYKDDEGMLIMPDRR